MKRTAAAFMIVAGLGGGCTTTDNASAPKIVYPSGPTPGQFMGPHGEPVKPVSYMGGPESGIGRADGRDLPRGSVVQASAAENWAYTDKTGLTAKGAPVATGSDGMPGFYPGRGILPVPAMG